MLLLKLAQIDPTEVCLVRDRTHAHKLRLANAESEEAAAAVAVGVTSGLANPSSFSSTKSASNKNASKARVTKLNELATKKKQAKITDVQHEESELFFNDLSARSNIYAGLLIDEVKLAGELRKIDESLSDALYKDLWVNLAEMLIDNGFFHVARDYLFECLNACNVRFIYLLIFKKFTCKF